MTEWRDDLVTGWHWWQDDRLTGWRDYGMAGWQDDQMTGWQEASQTIDRMVYLSLLKIFTCVPVAADGGDREPAGQVCAGRDAGAGSWHRPAPGQVIRLHPLAAAHLRICTIIIIIIYYYYYHLPCIILPISQATPYIANITELLDKTSMKLYFPNLIYL